MRYLISLSFCFLSSFVFADDDIKIIGQKAITTRENTSVKIVLEDITIEDQEKKKYPQGFTLRVYDGDNYSVSGHTVIPRTNFTGTLIVPVRVYKGDDRSNKYSLKVEVKKNQVPVITGQVPLSITAGQSITILLTHLVVRDNDDTYPADFTLKVFSGENYTLTSKTVKPKTNFTGTLSVRVTVNDGKAESEPFDMKIQVGSSNQKPVISGQAGLTTVQNKAITITLAHLTVIDPDSKYPDAFTLSLAAGTNYSVSDNTVTPANNFIGTLSVNTTVHDGHSSSETFSLKIQVIAKGDFQITGQLPLEMTEDSTFNLQLTHFLVSDPEVQYPNGFTLNILAGNNYSVADNWITPARDFNGPLTVKVSVTRNNKTTNPFDALITVKPVNDAPTLKNLDARPLFISGADPHYLARNALTEDIDDTELMYAEVYIEPEKFQLGTDQLLFENMENIKGSFDAQKGILLIKGKASLEEYNEAIQSVSYTFTHQGERQPTNPSKKIYFRLNDGKNTSENFIREVVFNDNEKLIIPTGFTPNNDRANDTWRITPTREVDRENNMVIHVYNKRGLLVYQAVSLEQEWDGRLNGELLPTDTYYYTIEIGNSNNSNKISYKGVVTILY